MKVAKTIYDVHRCVCKTHAEGKTIALVPTMGALHEGHFSLIRAAKASGAFVAVSIFVNPLQFGPNEDFNKYPRKEEKDLEGCRSCGVDLVFMPSPQVMYGTEPMTKVSVSGLSDVLCGASRPGHFDGVCTVVAKLFNIFEPNEAYFGAKDFQQVTIIRRMAMDLDFPIRIVVCPTVREPDGLAMSSRNAYLTPAHRAQARELYQSLQLGREMIRRSHPDPGQILEAIKQHLAGHAPDGAVDYIRIVDPATLRDVQSTMGKVLIAMAVRFGSGRLIDNMMVDDAAQEA